MKKRIVLVAFAMIATFFIGNSQNTKFGFKAGLNYNNFGDGSLKESSNDLISGAKNKAGFHVGMFVQAKLSALGLYIRPEFVYTQLKSNYAWSSTDNYGGEFKMSKIDIPFLVGTNIVGPLHVFAGPSFQFIVDSQFNAIDITKIKTDDFTLGIQMGVGLNLGKLGLEVRWERGLNKTESFITRNVVNAENVVIDTRPNQIMFGVSYTFNDNK